MTRRARSPGVRAGIGAVHVFDASDVDRHQAVSALPKSRRWISVSEKMSTKSAIPIVAA